jgi:hypothetical protein
VEEEEMREEGGDEGEEMDGLERKLAFDPADGGDGPLSQGQGPRDAQRGGRVVAEYPSWQPCARVVSKERADYWEFVVRFFNSSLSLAWDRPGGVAQALSLSPNNPFLYDDQLCNVFFAVSSLIFSFFRHQKLAARQYFRLAARIGIPLPLRGGSRREGGGWGAGG